MEEVKIITARMAVHEADIFSILRIFARILEIGMKNLFFLLASLAMVCFVCDSCNKDSDNSHQGISEETHQGASDTEEAGGEDGGWDYPALRDYEIVFYSCDEELNPEYKPLTPSVEFDGNDYFITVYNKKTGTFIAGDKYYSMEVKILKGDDIFNLKVQKLTANEYHECTLTPKALGSCTLGVKVSNPSDERSVYVQRAEITVERKQNYYLGMENGAKLPANKVGFFGNTLEYKFCWKVNNDGSLSNLNGTDEKEFQFFYTGNTLTITKAPSQDGTHIVYTVKRPSASASFLNEPVMFIYNTEESTYIKSVIFTTYNFSTYPNTVQ